MNILIDLAERTSSLRVEKRKLRKTQMEMSEMKNKKYR